MKPRFARSALTVLLFVLSAGRIAVGQPPGTPKRSYFIQAVALHREGQHGAALAKIKQALVLDLCNYPYRAYRWELERLAAEEKADLQALGAAEEDESPWIPWQPISRTRPGMTERRPTQSIVGLQTVSAMTRQTTLPVVEITRPRVF